MRGAVPLAIFLAFVAGVAVDGWLRTYGPPKPAIGVRSRFSHRAGDDHAAGAKIAI